MSVLIDGFAAASDRTTGWERYARALVAEFTRDPRGLDIQIAIPGSGANRLRWELIDLPRLQRSKSPVVTHFPAAPPSPFFRGKTITTVHDATQLFHPEWISRGAYWYYRHRTRWLLKAANSWILTVSEASRNDLILAGADHSRVFVAQNGLVFDDSAPPPALSPYVAERIGARPFVLFVGTLQPRKNLQTLLRAWRRTQTVGCALVLVGRQGWGPGQDVPDGVVELGVVSDDDLRALYTHTAALVTPSLYEGFGLPLLEALAVGTTVVASDIPAHREVGADAALYFPPLNEDALAATLERALTMPESERAAIKLAAKSRATAFSWRRCADEVATAYQAVIDA